MSEINESVYVIPDRLDPVFIYGRRDTNLRLIEENLMVKIVGRGNQIRILGEPGMVDVALTVLEDLAEAAARKKSLTESDILTSIQIARQEKQFSNLPGLHEEFPEEFSIVTIKNNLIRPKTDGQRLLIETIARKDIVFAVGPAGTGKTYLAVAMAVHYLKTGRVKKLILARPAVEAGESLGYLPGDYKEKIDPYLKPLYDSLEDMMPLDLLRKYLDQQVIEISPLAYMRGRTLNNAFVILDEAQNTTFTQMKMFLTRIGVNSRAVITGDVTQIDLPTRENSGLTSSITVLKNVPGIAFIEMKKDDVVRHRLVKDIIEAYDQFGMLSDMEDNGAQLENTEENE